MASNYIIDYTDPLSGSFLIPDGGFNGPGGRETQTTLRLYGRGAREWGEAVNENQVKLLENFMGASAPLYPTPGQLWLKAFLYYYDTDAQQFYVFNTGTKTWSTVVATTSTTQPAGVTGAYWYNTVTGVLRKFFQAYKQQAAAWHERAFTTGSGAPGAFKPRQEMKMWDTGTADWVQPPIVLNQTSTVAPNNNAKGTLRLNPSSSTMSYWNGTSWIELAASGNPVFNGDIDALGYKVINLGDATADTNALNRRTADARFLKLSGGTMTGAITLSGLPTQNLHAAPKQYVDTTATTTVNNALAALVTFPPGGIIMWSGATIPTGWIVCNGQNGTPDLRDRFVIGAGNAYTLNSMGGSKDTPLINHTHTFNGNITGTGGGHWHKTGMPLEGNPFGVPVARYGYAENWTGVRTAHDGGPGYDTYTSTDGEHWHYISGSITASGSSNGVNANLPPYVTLYYIMKT